MKTVLVNVRQIHDRNGRSVLRLAKPVVYSITAVYEDGRVRTTSGDVWKVRPCSTGRADFEVNEPVQR